MPSTSRTFKSRAPRAKLRKLFLEQLEDRRLLTSNLAPTIDSIPNIRVQEDTNYVSLELSGIGAGGDEDQHLRVTATSSGNWSMAEDILIDVGDRPFFTEVGDFNDDGNYDTATVNYSDDTVTIMLGNGVGEFSNSGTFSTGKNPTHLAISDFNSDGKQDLAIANRNEASIANGDTISILLGDGTGSFTLGETLSVGQGPEYVVAHDLNSDGNWDLAVSNGGSNTVSILLGNGSGNFTRESDLTVGAAPHELVAGDFNADEKVDLAVANRTSNNVSVLMGNADGTFEQAIDFAANADPTPIATYDLNNDCQLDLIVGNSNGVSVLLADGSGSFASPTLYTAGSTITGVELTDLDQDGNIDIVVAAANTGGNNIYRLSGNGDGSFRSLTPIAVGSNPRSVPATSLNADSFPDLIVSNQGSDNLSI